ncbi:MAG: hypothetical protein LBG73_01030 [Spirochaetaceae bacterium]|jgi:hypothetical protein|nr:hypothetical protein [Spirochaetaceae bacterium]
MRKADVFLGGNAFCRVILPTAILALAGCFPIDDGFNPEDWSWDAGGGRVYIRIALNTARFAVDLDNPTQEHIGYFEAVFKESGLPNAYYIGSATAGEEYITVAVPYGKNYDILVLAGTPANGQVYNGVKVLLASGFTNYTVIYGQNIVSVPMTLHKTADSLDWNEATEKFTYKPAITGVGALQSANTAGANLFYDTAPRAYLTPYPEVYSAAHQRPPIAVSEGTGSVELTITDTLPDAAKSGVLYRCYYNLTYYGFSDSSSGSSPWNIRRGVTNQLYTQDAPYGGGVPISYCYYVKADGNDADAGYLKEKPFKTLAKAVKAVRDKTIPWIKTIAVLGTLNWASESAQADANYKEGGSVFAVKNSAFTDEIRITGDPAITDGVPAVLSGMTGRRVFYITGANTKLKFDRIAVSGGYEQIGGGFNITGQAKVELDSVIVENNSSTHGGTYISEAGTELTLIDCTIRDNKSQQNGGGGSGFDGGGVYVTSSGIVNMKGSTVIAGNTAQRYGGGVYAVNSGIFNMYQGSIAGNTAPTGKSIYGYTGTVTGVTLSSVYFENNDIFIP